MKIILKFDKVAFCAKIFKCLWFPHTKKGPQYHGSKVFHVKHIFGDCIRRADQRPDG